MMMQMLKAGGMPVVTDNIRKPDEDNPRGYYEFGDFGTLVSLCCDFSYVASFDTDFFIHYSRFDTDFLPIFVTPIFVNVVEGPVAEVIYEFIANPIKRRHIIVKGFLLCWYVVSFPKNSLGSTPKSGVDPVVLSKA